MKNLILLISMIFILTSCVNQEQVIVRDMTPSSNVKIDNEVVDRKITIIENIEDNFSTNVYKIALLFPSKIVGKYSYDLVNTVLTYQLEQKKEFEIEIFDSTNESEESLETTIISIKDKGFNDLIALVTEDGFSKIENSETLKNMRVYFPIINKKSSTIPNDNYIYGGINYKQQLEKLVLYSDLNIVDFYDESSVGQKLNGYLKDLSTNVIYERAVGSQNSRYKNFIDDIRVNDSTVILNTPIIKSSILLSQLRANDKIVPKIILSTQLNYSPLIFSLTQKEDRENFVVVNSIGEIDKKLIERLELLDVDILYNFVAYSSLIGIDYLFSNNSTKLLIYDVIENEVIYSIKLYKTLEDSFEEIK